MLVCPMRSKQRINTRWVFQVFEMQRFFRPTKFRGSRTVCDLSPEEEFLSQIEERLQPPTGSLLAFRSKRMKKLIVL